MSAHDPGVRRVTALVGAVALVAAALTALAFSSDTTTPRTIALPWVVIAIACVATELFLVHFEHRREAHSVSFSAIPIVIGLYTLTPRDLIVAVLLGSLFARFAILRQAPIKGAVNVVTAWIGTAAAAAVFDALAAPGDGTATWLAAIVAAVIADAMQNVAVSAAISLYQGKLEVMPAVAILGAVSALANTAFALIAVTLFGAEPFAVLLLAALLPVLYVSYRVHARLREQHRDLEQLYHFSRRITAAVADGQVVATLIGHLRELMHAEDAWICVPTSDGSVVRVRADDVETVSVPMPAGGVDDVLHRTAQDAGEPVLIDASTDSDLGAALRSLGIRQALIAPLGAVSSNQGTIVVTDRSGDVRPFGTQDMRLFATLVSHAGASLENSHLLDRLREQAAASEHQALHDTLTGLPNRTLFGQRVAAALQAKLPAAVLLLDLDRFKEVNDTLGHHNGDVLLEEVGRRLASVLRHGDTVARLGGDEFAVLLPDIAAPEAAVQVARGLLAVLERPVTLSGVSISVGGSIGIALAPDHGDEPSLLLQRADVAMYTAKAAQSDIELYDADRDVYSPDRLALAADLRHAIERGELQVHFQPQVELATGMVVGAEALVRWIDESGWRMSPAELVSLAEHTGLIAPLTKFVLRTAAEECSRWRTSGRGLRVSVNLSARTFLDDGLADDVRKTLAEFSIPASSLCLELTETCIMADQERTIEVLHELRAIGVTVAVDDFGIGYSSLAYLARLPVGEIKIDKSFVMQMTDEPSSDMIVRSVVDLAANLGIPVVAEGVETVAAKAALEGLGCELGQGYLFSRPVSAEDFAAWLTAHVTPRILAAAPMPTRAWASA